MKKVLIFAITLIISVSAVIISISGNAAPQLSLETVEAFPGDTVSVSLKIKNNPGIVSMTLKLSYDSDVLTLTDVKDGGILGKESHKPEYKTPYTLAWVNDTATTNYTQNGTLVTLTFKLSENAVPKKSYPISVSYDADNYDIYNKDLACIDFNISNGAIVVKKEKTIVPISDLSYRIVSDGICITGYKGNDSDIVISDTYTINEKEYPVTMIDDYAFEDNTDLVSCDLGSPVKINSGVFDGCTNLKSITIHTQSFESGAIDSGAFENIGDDAVIYGYYDALYSTATSENRNFGALDAGDINGDDNLSVEDYSKIVNIALGADEATEKEQFLADLDGDGVVDVLDCSLIERKISAE